MASLGNRFSLTCSYHRTQPQPWHSWAIYSRESSHGNLHTHVYSCFIQNSPKQRIYPAVLQSMNGYTVEHMYCVIHSVTETNYRLKHAVTSMDLRRIRLDEEKVSRKGLQHCVMFFTDSLGMRKLWEGDQAWTVRD